MKPFRKHVALAVDGGGIRGVVVTQALAMLEEALGKPAHEIFQLAVGTSTGAIIAAGLGAHISAQEMTQLYRKEGPKIFRRSWRTALFPLSKVRYPAEGLAEALRTYFGERRMGDFWISQPPMDVVITTIDLAENRTRFVKPWKEEYADWPVAKAVQASCTVPTYFPVVEGRYIDGGVGSYANPCYLAAYEAQQCLGWDPAETTLISLGTGREPHAFAPENAGKLWAWDWLMPMLGAFLQSAYDQQVHLVDTYFPELDFRRFQVDLEQPIEMDAADQVDRLAGYGVRLGRMILNDAVDRAQGVSPKLAPEKDGLTAARKE